MLEQIKELQANAVVELIEVTKKKREVFFKAPTGSGKTFMMADFINSILSQTNDVVFLVSSLSKGDLAKQNYEKFCQYNNKQLFNNINPYLINSENAGEERLFIPETYNVYLLPRDLYKDKSKIKEQGVLDNFFLEMRARGKFIYLIKDECHIATKNLDILNHHFEKIINFSATPKISRGQLPDVEISNQEATDSKLIKNIQWHDDDTNVEDAIKKFESIKEDYRNLLGVNPCLIIQISNEVKADEELNNMIFPILNKMEHQDLKWMLIVNENKKCDTNDTLKAKKLPVEKWKDYAKGNMANIDIIIFKMVITEGWDIPRACMLYQLRDAKSKQLTEQVIGRVRRNPRLLDFETLNEKAQELALTAWVWGIQPSEETKFYSVSLQNKKDIKNDIKIKTTRLKELKNKVEFSLSSFLEKQEEFLHTKSIFDLGRDLKKANNEVVDMIYDYSTNYSLWFKAANNVDKINKENEKYICDYSQSMEVEKDDKGHEIEVSFSEKSCYIDEGNYENIDNWVWRRDDNGDKFAFDSDAERQWASILKDLSHFSIAKANDNNDANDKLSDLKIESNKEICLWGKNYVTNSSIKFGYYLGASRFSYPDFLMKDSFGRIHIFEVKSVNEGYKIGFDNNIYKAKVGELKKAYKQASLLTGHIFYLPLTKNDIWQISCYDNGEESTLTKEDFLNKVKKMKK